ncbi:MAG: 50S ribosomal protein L24 [candidate division CPR1 bacterium GW2011_GWC1_49_13]|uniref:Large ribosomal subunit protein uL24 n=1 Tax=candidate division CPR1 bacterium GW2011_GWC1_49_13 TaxID=1618342 RepID=A0A0G1VHH0_9BACT|nr:MAG: 50S ribosomal protein L24 [candidate division CPR1 bacterium GW2011_GWC1_49_13]
MMKKLSLKIKKGDKVKVLAGKDAGKEGEVLAVNPKTSRVVVSGVNLLKHFLPKSKGAKGQEEGGIVEREAPLASSKLAVICPKCKKAVRLGKNRVCKNCGAKI